MIKLYDQPFLHMHYDQHLRLLESEWLNENVGVEQFREGLWQSLLMAERYQVQAWLSDLRRLPALLPTEHAWLHQQYFPRYQELPLHKVAVVKPANAVRHEQLQTALRTARSKGLMLQPHVMYFDGVEEARRWVRQPLVSMQLPPRD
ncbi:hypothetical protein [Solirubrum puertoriconensis]|uniref:Uncharacterized protein n=1 Tax=Solirubrum puertoriconensis TaxID=1751427 RepID=A0A9X0HHC7_SOLP1|nr:hypothetical protein [Solirubrum puertoriconensis]KUG05893.1 hypothetical protein ASU33_00445 [Solirubrum puertoriconensis]